MIVLVQWAQTTPKDWVSIDLTPTGAGAKAWTNLAKKSVPTSASVLDNTAGWLFSVMIQGVDLYGFDHVAIEPITGGGVRAYGWVDDTADVTFQYRWGEVWEFRPGAVDRSVTIAGATIRHQGPDQRKTIYSESLTDMANLAPKECGGMAVPVLPWLSWPAPAAAITKHGIWVQDAALWQQHFTVRRKPSYREWTP